MQDHPALPLQRTQETGGTPLEAVLMLLFLPVSLRAKRAENGGELPSVPVLLFVNTVQLALTSAGLFIVAQVIAYVVTGHFIR